MIVEQTYITDHGRRRRRMVRVELDVVRRGLGAPATEDRTDWRRIRELLAERVGPDTFAIWLEPVELIAIDGDRRLVLDVAPARAAWTTKRFGRVLEASAARVGREVRFADERERRALGADAPSSSTFSTNQREAAG